MYGPKNRSSAVDKYRVTLEADERATLERLVAVGKGAARRLTHARILLLADAAGGADGCDYDIMAALGCSLRTIARVRKRFVTESLDAAVSPRPQPPPGSGHDRASSEASPPAGPALLARQA